MNSPSERRQHRGPKVLAAFAAMLLGCVPAWAQVAPNLGTTAPFTVLGTNAIPTSGTVTCTDTGPGIGDEEKEKLFLPYFSGRKGGTGLGLAIANKIVTDHSGRIVVRDNSPRGSVFTVEIPVA